MNKEDTIRMAREAGFYIEHNEIYSMSTQSDHELTEPIERFADLIASAEREACAELVWPKLKVWSEEEQTAMGLAFNRAQEKHGWYETLMAVGASVLKIKAEAIRARGSHD